MAFLNSNTAKSVRFGIVKVGLVAVSLCIWFVCVGTDVNYVNLHHFVEFNGGPRGPLKEISKSVPYLSTFIFF